MSKPRPPFYEDVLDRWAAGQSAGFIALMLKLRRPETASVIVQRARDRGDPRAVRRGTQPQFARLNIPMELAQQLRKEAARRDLPPTALALQILDTMCRDNLFGAVLDA